jgi:serine/threonine protein kinase
MPFVIGENVGPYRLVEQLGQGGMATVFKAYHPALNRYVAIKALHLAFTHEPNFLARFQREAQVVAGLEHSNIVPIYDYAEHEGRPYLVMKFIEGETLKARLGRGPLDAGEMMRVVESVGAALGYAHSQGVLHRDVKPSNVLLASDDRIYLADFGLARMAEAGESTLSADVMLGTPQYISPEQAMGQRDLDNGADIYSFGVLLYELIVGKVPYSADTPFSVIHDHIYTPLPMPRSIQPYIPEAVERVLLKALAKSRADRYADVDSMVEAWKQAVAEPAGPQATPPAEKTQPTVSVITPAVSGPPGGSISPVQTAIIDEDQLASLVNAQSAQPPGALKAAKPRPKQRSFWVWAGISGALGISCLCLAVVFVAVLRPRREAAATDSALNTAIQPAALMAETATPSQAILLPSPVKADPRSTPAISGPLPQASRMPGLLATFASGRIGPPSVPLETALAWTTAQPDDPKALVDLAIAYWAEGKPLDARQALETASQKAGNDPGFFVRAGDAMVERQAWVFASGLYLEALKLSPPPMPDELDQKLNLALYLSAGAPEAAALFNRLPEGDLKPGMVELLRGRSALYRGDLVMAKGSVKKIKEKFSAFSELDLLEAEIALKEGDRNRGKQKLQDLMNNPATPVWAGQAADYILKQLNQK